MAIWLKGSPSLCDVVMLAMWWHAGNPSSWAAERMCNALRHCMLGDSRLTGCDIVLYINASAVFREPVKLEPVA